MNPKTLALRRLQSILIGVLFFIVGGGNAFALSHCRGDLNNDGAADLRDFHEILLSYQEQGSLDLSLLHDLILLLQGSPCVSSVELTADGQVAARGINLIESHFSAFSHQVVDLTDTSIIFELAQCQPLYLGDELLFTPSEEEEVVDELDNDCDGVVDEDEAPITFGGAADCASFEMLPVSSSDISCGYDCHGSRSPGLDWTGALNDPVVAPTDAVVVEIVETAADRPFQATGDSAGCSEQMFGATLYICCNSGFGRKMTLKTSGGQRLTIGHLSALNVELNQVVRAGDVVGYMGNSGFTCSRFNEETERSSSEAVHLHLSIQTEDLSYIDFTSCLEGKTFPAPPTNPAQCFWVDGSYQGDCPWIDPPADCSTPWGGARVSHGESVTAFREARVSHGESCADERRTCSDGTLSGSFSYQSCTVDDPPADCSTPWGGARVSHGESVTAFREARVSHGESCADERRTCSDGTLSGSFSYEECSVDPAPDRFEANNTLSTSTSLSAGSYTTLTISSSEDEDWFKIDVCEGKTLTASIQFDHDDGDLDLKLRSSSSSVLSSSTSTSDNETVSGNGTGDMYVQVYGYAGARAPYSLNLSLTGSCTPPPEPRVFNVAPTSEHFALGEYMTITWDTENIGESESMTVSLKRDSYTGSTEGPNFLRLSTSTTNDGSYRFRVPTTGLNRARDWRVYVKQTSTGVWAAAPSTITVFSLSASTAWSSPGPCDPSSNRGIYQGKANSVTSAQNKVNMTFKKCDGSNPTVNVTLWGVVTDLTYPSDSTLCTSSTCTRLTTSWSSSSSTKTVEIEAWPSMSALKNALCGSTKRIMGITDGQGGIGVRRWYQYQSTLVYKRCD